MTIKKGRSKTYIVKGDPIPLARGRFGKSRIYDSQKHLKLIWTVALSNQHDDEPLFTGALQIDATFYMPMPKSFSKKYEMMVNMPHIYKPDADNLLKWVMDCASKGVLFKDDCSVALGSFKKLYDYEDKTRTEFTLTELRY